jgi:hypothetical protein
METDELGDVTEFQLVHAGDTEQAHRALDLRPQDLDRAVDTKTPSGHQPVEVGAADHREVGAMGECCRNVLSTHHSGVRAARHSDVQATR